MLNDHIAGLIARKLSGEATAEELQKLDLHMRSNPADQYFEELFASYWSSHLKSSNQQDPNSDEHFKHILELADEELPRRSRRIVWIKRLSIAAILIALVAGTYIFFPRGGEPGMPQQNEVMAKKGVRSKLVLPDGSQVWLNSETRLVYPVTFSDSTREVELEGEAYFDVTKDSKRPFVVHTSGIDIRVLGTTFNVKSYTAEPTIEAVLVHGSIEVIKKNQPGAPRLILHPHQKLVFNKVEDVQEAKRSETAAIAPKNTTMSVTTLPKNIPDTSIIETSYVYNKFKFDGEKFSELAPRMERWFNVKIQFKNDKVAEYRLRGSFINETIEEALQALQLFVPFSYNKNGDEIMIDKK